MNESVIPYGDYCYSIEKVCKDNGHIYIKMCPYYHWVNDEHDIIRCDYLDFNGFDACLYDQCKICGINDDYDEENT